MTTCLIVVSRTQNAQPLYNSSNNNNPTASDVVKDEKPRTNNTYGNNNNNNNNNSNMHASPVASSNPYGGSQPMSQGSAPIVRVNTSDSQIYTQIADLNLNQSRWTIKARITVKSEVRTWSNAKGEGSLFSVELKGTFFKGAVDKWYDILQESKVYTLSGGRLKVANARWNNCRSQYEVTFDQNSEIHLLNEAVSGISANMFDFCESIASLEAMPIVEERQTLVDVLAYVQSVGDVQTLISKKKGQEFSKADVVLVDDSNAQINLTLWGETAHKAAANIPIKAIVAVRRARLSEFGGGKSLSGGVVTVWPPTNRL
jgi:replication factor A1